MVGVDMGNQYGMQVVKSVSELVKSFGSGYSAIHQQRSAFYLDQCIIIVKGFGVRRCPSPTS